MFSSALGAQNTQTQQPRPVKNDNEMIKQMKQAETSNRKVSFDELLTSEQAQPKQYGRGKGIRNVAAQKQQVVPKAQPIAEPAPKKETKPKVNIEDSIFYQAMKQGSQTENVPQRQEQDIDAIMKQQAKEDKILDDKRLHQLHQEQLESQKTDMRFILAKADKESSKTKKQKPPAEEREDIEDVRRRQEVAKKQIEPKYKVNPYGLRTEINPKPSKQEAAQPAKGKAKQPVKKSQPAKAQESDEDHEINIKVELDSDDDHEVRMLRQANTKYQQEKPKKKKNKKLYDSEDDSSDQDLASFMPKSLQKKKEVKPMSKRQMKKDNVMQSSLATLYDQTTLKQKMRMNDKINK